MTMESSSREPRTSDVVAEELWALLKLRRMGDYDPELNREINRVMSEFEGTGHLPVPASEKDRPELVYPLDDDRRIKFSHIGSQGWVAQALTSERLQEQEAAEAHEEELERAVERRRSEATPADDPIKRAQRAIERLANIKF
jgi:hypothetical protein